MQTRLSMFVAVAAVYLLHQDVWFWRSVQPLVFGFLPVGLAYHAAYCLAAAALMWALTKIAWPYHLDTEARSGFGPGAGAGDTQSGVRPPSPFKR